METTNTSFQNPREIIQKFNKKLKEENIAPGIKIGERAPDFTLPNENNESINLNDILTKGPVVLSFYRGAWCINCNRELHELQSNYQKITKLGTTILAIAPQLADNALPLKENHSIQFNLLSDSDFKVIKDYKLQFKLNEEVQTIYKMKFNLNLPEHTANETWELPVPATFILDSKGIVRDRFVETDYTQRMSTEKIIQALEQIRSSIDFNRRAK